MPHPPRRDYLEFKMTQQREREGRGEVMTAEATSGTRESESVTAGSVESAVAGSMESAAAAAVGSEAADSADAVATLRLFVVLSRAFRAISEHARRDMERHDLGASEFAVLEILHNKGRLPLGEVASGVLLTSGSTTYVIDKLEGRGLLKRLACPSDRRVTWAELTPEGEALMARVFPHHTEALRAASAGLTTEEKRIAAALLKRLGLHAQDAL